jgi:hypothetical protein
MKISTSCHKCTFDNPKNNIRVEGFISIQEEDLYHFKCIYGHDNLLELQAFKFEILFESGLCAIKDKYYLESVLSITASLERFYEFFIKIILKSNGLEYETVEEIYKNMSKQSERQVGAFISLYGLKYKEAPILLKNKSTEFRNDVIHKGYMPHEEEVLNYAEEIFNIIKFYYLKILTDYDSLITDNLFESKKQRRIKFKKMINLVKVPITNLCPAFVLTHTLNASAFSKKDFRESFEIVRNTKFYG